MAKSKAIIVTGATGSGKSAFALELAVKNNGIIVNADSMQIYQQIPILSAQPSINDQKLVKHTLYGFKDITKTKSIYSVGMYLQDLKSSLNEVIAYKKTPIIVGGTMLYIDAILNGLNEIDDISQQRKQEIRQMYQNKKVEELYQELLNIDDKYAQIVDKNNPHRLLRGIEVKLATGKSIIDFWQKQRKNEINEQFELEKYFIDLPRNILYVRINRRFDNMINDGVIDEVQNLLKTCMHNNIDIKTIPKAIGLYEIFDYLQNKISLNEAVEKSKQFSRNYAKRQLTWFYNKLDTGFTKIAPNI